MVIGVISDTHGHVPFARAAVRMLERCRLLSREFVLVSDLRRGRLATVGVYLLTALVYRDPMTKTDGRLSAARAFSWARTSAWARFRISPSVRSPG